MKTAQDAVRRFREATGLPCGDEREPAVRNEELHADLLNEECWELYDAMGDGSLPAVADAIADIIYIALGAACDFGLDMGPIWDEVCASNLTKAGAPRNAAGKLTKGPNYRPPDVAGCIDAQRRRKP